VTAGACLDTLTGAVDEKKQAQFTVALNGLRARGFMHAGFQGNVALSANGRTVVYGSWDATVWVWDVGTGRCLHTLRHDTAVLAVAISADGRIAASAGIDGTMRVWDIAAGTCLHTIAGEAPVVSVALSADGRVAVSCGWDRTARVWDIATGARVATLTGHDGFVASVALSADATLAVTGSIDQTARVWMLDWDYEFGADDSAGTTLTSRVDRQE
jgi:WD40 repeat protein